MKQKLISALICAAVLIALCPVVLAEGEAIVPSAPSWVPEEEYTVFPGSTAYIGETWDLILEGREYAAGGGVRDAAYLEGLGARLKELEKRTGDIGIQFETGLVEAKLFANGEDWNQEESGYTQFNIAAYSGSTQPLSQRYVLGLWLSRAAYRPGRMSADMCRTFANSMHLLLYSGEFSMERLIDTPMLQIAPPEVTQSLRDMIFVQLEGLLLYPRYDSAMSLGNNKYELSGAYAQNGTTMVQIRALAEALGVKVGWDGDTQSVTLTGAEDTIVLTLGKTTATKNGKEFQLSAAPYAEKGRTYLPLRFVSEQLSQAVNWEQARRLVTIGSAYTPRHYLERWALPMGSMLNFMNSGYTPNRFGGVGHLARGSGGAFTVYQPRTPASGASTLTGSWSIDSREDLIETVASMTFYGHNGAFMEMVAFRQSLSDTQYQQILDNANETDKYMFPYTDALYEKWGDRGIMCWDLFRMSNVVQWGYTAEYLTYEEALAMLEPAVVLLKENFSNWDEAYENYLDGYNWWARNNVLGKDIWTTERGKNYLTMKGDPTISPIFDDSLFTSELEEAPGVSFKELVSGQ